MRVLPFEPQFPGLVREHAALNIDMSIMVV
jgi:hypothetical protein